MKMAMIRLKRKELMTFNDTEKIRPKFESRNSSEGGKMKERYRQDTGPNYEPQKDR